METERSEGPVAASEQSIVGGTLTSSMADNPWQVSLRLNGATFCGGVILNENWILTAGYCFYGYANDPVSVVAGSPWRLGTEGQHRGVAHVFDHPAFVHDPRANDLTLLRLDAPLDLGGPHAKAISRLSAADGLAGLPNIGDTARISGYGYLAYPSQGSPSTGLRTLDVSVVNNSAGQAYYPPGMGPTAAQIVAAVPGGGPCQNDAGGPLTVLKDGTRVLAGIISLDHGCGDPLYPGVYTRVSSYEEWIDSVAGKTLFFQAGINNAVGPGPVFSFNVPPGAPALEVFLSQGFTTGFISARAGQMPTDTVNDCRVSGTLGSRVCRVNRPVPGTWYVRLTGRVSQASLNVVIPGVP
ncbi:trypsin-like serine protease [Myxococcus hansupus]|uniref:trypsin-like serine protease n=1 Tax=Pseudomyxococcus hansupus TaxID=1297742 RepID=UPI000675D069|nr:trypsin-like serine protease [Myxococcus hansupus]